MSKGKDKAGTNDLLDQQIHSLGIWQQSLADTQREMRVDY